MYAVHQVAGFRLSEYLDAQRPDINHPSDQVPKRLRFDEYIRPSGMPGNFRPQFLLYGLPLPRCQQRQTAIQLRCIVSFYAAILRRAGLRLFDHRAANPVAYRDTEYSTNRRRHNTP